MSELDALNAAGKRLLAAWIKAGWIKRTDIIGGKLHITWSDEGKVMISYLVRILEVSGKPMTEADARALAWLSECGSGVSLN